LANGSSGCGDTALANGLYQAIVENMEVLVTLEDAKANAKVLEAIFLSAKEKRTSS